jgi:hypothetical protein
MKTSTPVKSITRLIFSSWFFVGLFSCATLGSVWAADAAKEASTQTATPNYTVPQSISIDRLIQKLYANSPLNISVLRKVLVDANPKVITGNPQQRVKAGTSIVVPDHGVVVKHVLTPFAAAPAETQETHSNASDYQARKHWVRFP